MCKRPVAAFPGRARPASRDLPADGPHVCLLYESEEEQHELSRRLREAGLDTVAWELVDLRSDKRLSPCLGAMRRSPRRLLDVVGAGSLATVAILGSHWPLIAALTLAVAPFLVVLWLLRGFRPSTATVAE